jgi:hypothetical protein
VVPLASGLADVVGADTILLAIAAMALCCGCFRLFQQLCAMAAIEQQQRCAIAAFAQVDREVKAVRDLNVGLAQPFGRRQQRPVATIRPPLIVTTSPAVIGASATRPRPLDRARQSLTTFGAMSRGRATAAASPPHGASFTPIFGVGQIPGTTPVREWPRRRPTPAATDVPLSTGHDPAV